MKKYLSALVVSCILVLGIPTLAAEGNDPNLEGCDRVYNECNRNADSWIEDLMCASNYGYCKAVALGKRIYHEIMD